MAKIGMTGTSGSVITLNYLPQYLIVGNASPDAGEPFENFTQLNVSVNGTETVSLSTNSILEQAFGCSNQVGGSPINSGGMTQGYLPKQSVLPLADGKIENVNVNISVTSTTDHTIYANSSNLGTENYFWSTSSVNALSNNVYSDFRTLTVPDQNGELIVQWKNGFSDKFTIDANSELVSLASAYMSSVTTLAVGTTLFNYDDSIASAQWFNTDSSNAQICIVQR